MNKRILPRHVDGRIKVGPMPLKNFFIFLPIAIIIIIITFNNITPLKFFFGVIIIGLFIILFAEFNQKETGLDICKDIIRYKIEGDIIFERSCNNIEDHKRFIRNEIKERKTN